LFAAATVKVTPELIALATAVSSEFDPPVAAMLMFATAGLIRFAATQLIPAIRSEICPPPVQGRTRTACMIAFFATP
jgi:hypothetical protein